MHSHGSKSPLGCFCNYCFKSNLTAIKSNYTNQASKTGIISYLELKDTVNKYLPI